MLSRRLFLRSAGITVMAVGPLSTASCHVRRAVDNPAFALAVILGDSALCVGCRRCELVCSSLHHFESVWPEQARLSVDARVEERRFIDGLWFADACHECPVSLSADEGEIPPPCVNACPTGSLHLAFSGESNAAQLRLRVVEPSLCDGCGDCVPACPYGTVTIDAESGLAVMCDLCVDREGGPACVAACPSTALRYYEPWRHLPARPFAWEEGNR